jgi:2-oxoglutarate dehydrogenase E1 component
MIYAMDIWKDFHGPNAGYVIELYERYRKDPHSVDEATRALFERSTPPIDGGSAAESPTTTTSQTTTIAIVKIVGAANLAQSIRAFGFLEARLDPLGASPPGAPWLQMDFHGVTEADLRQLPAEVVGGPIAEETQDAWQAIQKLRSTYSTTIGYDYEHVRVPQEREWLRFAAECGRFKPENVRVDLAVVLERLTQVEAFELFLHRIFPGKTRFSIEGLDMLVPMMDEILSSAAEAGVCTIQIGMAHRGRLNVMAHFLGKPYAQILAEFKDPQVNLTTRNELGWTGDVKYHKGARHALKGGEMVKMILALPPNPSHLEHINPVVSGMARAAGTKVDKAGPPEFFPNAALPILIHGDTSFPAQGVVAETLNLAHLEGYSIAGTIHIIANNQLGYTTDPEESRSTLHASDLAKGFEIPIIHVNADDPERCLEAALTAFAYRDRFNKDFLINLIGYRRYGHNEGDEPSFTQPLMYQKINQHPTVRKKLADELVERGLLKQEYPEERLHAHMAEMQGLLDSLQLQQVDLEPQLVPPPPGEARRVKTAVPVRALRDLNRELLTLPENFTAHRKIERGMQRRENILDQENEKTIDWATAEELALASILADGIPIRLTGEDAARGTFSQRHSVFHDPNTGRTHTPLQALGKAKASFEVINSPLSENAAIGFEFGYNIQAPDRLVIWEAQYGDFINAAQAMIDEFLVSGRAKWEQTPSLVLLLPHGYEGQGPDHSSGRLERFLQLSAQTNLRIANCTTAAQYFHLLRRQAALLVSDPLPLILMTPKSLLRHPMVYSSPRELSEGSWQPVIPDPELLDETDQVKRLLLCSGKIYVDLKTSSLYKPASGIAIHRIEQLYPFPQGELQASIERFEHLDEIIWVQEEPKNMGAWTFVESRLLEIIGNRLPLRYVGRIQNSSPAEGSSAWHAVNQLAILRQALLIDSDVDSGLAGDEEMLPDANLVERE